MSLLLAAAIVTAIAAPHALRLEQSPPGLAAVIWFSALVLRALTALFAALAVLIVLPRTGLFDLVTHWCWHTALPLIATHLGLDGHRVGDAALVLPGIVLAASVLSGAFGVWKAARAVARLVQRTAVGPGPRDSVIVGDGDVMVAAAGIRRPRVLVSAGALTSFDDDELAASLDHEHGHIQRRHRYVLVVAEVCRALGRFLPGTRRAAQELVIHLERDADRFALRHHHEPVVLASAICKAARAGSVAPAAGLGGGGVVRRVRELLAADASRPQRGGVVAQGLASLLLVLILALSATLPSATLAAVHRTDGSVVRHCKS